jgi:glycosyltransferase involved in cell wall biosynthesis
MAANGFSRARIAVAPTGIDVDWLLDGRETTGTPGERTKSVDTDPLIGTVARLHPVKDLGTFMRACAVVAREIPGARFTIAGDGPERGALEQQAAQLGLADKLFFAGEVADVRPVLRRLDVFALSSLSESCPNALLEAMAFGIPCAATRVGGLPEIIEHGTNGLLSAPGNATELAANILALVRESELRRKISAEGARTVRERFALNSMIKSYLRLYRRLAT